MLHMQLYIFCQCICGWIFPFVCTYRWLTFQLSVTRFSSMAYYYLIKAQNSRSIYIWNIYNMHKMNLFCCRNVCIAARHFQLDFPAQFNWDSQCNSHVFNIFLSNKIDLYQPDCSACRRMCSNLALFGWCRWLRTPHSLFFFWSSFNLLATCLFAGGSVGEIHWSMYHTHNTRFRQPFLLFSIRLLLFCCYRNCWIVFVFALCRDLSTKTKSRHNTSHRRQPISTTGKKTDSIIK